MCRVAAEIFNDALPCLSKTMKYCLVYLCFMLLLNVGLGIRGFSNYLLCINESALPVRDRDPECERKAEEGSCDFFDCYENRFPCRTCGFAADPERNYCRRFFNNYSNFDRQGQQWITSAHQCLTRVMLSLYVQNSVSCKVSKRTMVDAVSYCYHGNSTLSFCDIFQTNQYAFLQLYNRRNMFEMIRATTELRELRQLCELSDQQLPFAPIHK
ncbi:uncharacterized protein LOC110452451 [Mizuhopecten yessoensis]|uniref:Uncharacterized protein n=1 Tax=Mizuhopecten yessoensis TaxID=6573 RepID=A0A210QJM1_MIZYE|nr:uncharacterized protein LOC110452451 [Mizuhopecten yessoensis]OWF48919.1 hypothetical protein KP79_PYT12471 [Mizuhopecten yessoensis]